MKSRFAKNSPIRLVSFFLIQSFILQQVAYAAPGFSPASVDIFKKSIVRFSFPESVATVDDAYHAPGSSKTVILMQDAHTNESGQKNLAKALDTILKSEKELKYVFLEAGIGDDSLSFLRKYADAAKREKIASSLLRQGILHGHEYYDLTSDREFKLWGVEDPSLYMKALEAYRYTATQRGRFAVYLDKIESAIKTLKTRVYNPRLLSFEASYENYLKEKLSLTEFFEILKKAAAERNIALAKYPHLKSLDELKTKETAIDFQKANEEQIKAISGLSSEAQNELADLSQNRKSPSKLSTNEHQDEKAFYALLEEKLGKDSLSRLPELSKYLSYLKEAKNIQAEKVLDEEKALEREVFSALSISEDEKNLLKSAEMLRSLRKLFDLTMTPEDFESYRADAASFSIAHLTGFLNKKIMDLKNFYESVTFLEEGFDDVIANAENFYAITQDRDRAFIKNLSEKMTAESQAKAVLITGGYHTSNLKSLLKRQNISFISVRPQIYSETNHEKYEKMLLGQNFITSPNLTQARSPKSFLDTVVAANNPSVLRTVVTAFTSDPAAFVIAGERPAFGARLATVAGESAAERSIDDILLDWHATAVVVRDMEQDLDVRVDAANEFLSELPRLTMGFGAELSRAIANTGDVRSFDDDFRDIQAVYQELRKISVDQYSKALNTLPNGSVQTRSSTLSILTSVISDAQRIAGARLVTFDAGDGETIRIGNLYLTVKDVRSYRSAELLLRDERGSIVKHDILSVGQIWNVSYSPTITVNLELGSSSGKVAIEINAPQYIEIKPLEVDNRPLPEFLRKPVSGARLSELKFSSYSDQGSQIIFQVTKPKGDIKGIEIRELVEAGSRDRGTIKLTNAKTGQDILDDSIVPANTPIRASFTSGARLVAKARPTPSDVIRAEWRAQEAEMGRFVKRLHTAEQVSTARPASQKTAPSITNSVSEAFHARMSRHFRNGTAINVFGPTNNVMAEAMARSKIVSTDPIYRQDLIELFRGTSLGDYFQNAAPDLYNDLVKNGYLNAKGILQPKFADLGGADTMQLDPRFEKVRHELYLMLMDRYWKYVEAFYLGGWSAQMQRGRTDQARDQHGYLGQRAAEISTMFIRHAMAQQVSLAKLSPEKRAKYRSINFYVPLFVDADEGHLKIQELVRTVMNMGEEESLIAALHIEDQAHGCKKCGHMSGKVLNGEDQWVRTLNSARFELDIAGLRVNIVARTDAEAAEWITSTDSGNDQKFLLGVTDLRAGYESVLASEIAKAKKEARPADRDAAVQQVTDNMGSLLRLVQNKENPALIRPYHDVITEARNAGMDGKQLQLLHNFWKRLANLSTLDKAVEKAIRDSEAQGNPLKMSAAEWREFINSIPRSNVNKQVKFLEIVKAKAKEIGINVRSNEEWAVLAKDDYSKALTEGINILWDYQMTHTEENERTIWMIESGMDMAISRSIAAMPYSDVLWFEQHHPHTGEVNQWGEAIDRAAINMLFEENYFGILGATTAAQEELIRPEIRSILETYLRNRGQVNDAYLTARNELQSKTMLTPSQADAILSAVTRLRSNNTSPSFYWPAAKSELAPGTLMSDDEKRTFLARQAKHSQFNFSTYFGDVLVHVVTQLFMEGLLDQKQFDEAMTIVKGVFQGGYLRDGMLAISKLQELGRMINNAFVENPQDFAGTELNAFRDAAATGRATVLSAAGGAGDTMALGGLRGATSYLGDMQRLSATSQAILRGERVAQGARLTAVNEAVAKYSTALIEYAAFMKDYPQGIFDIPNDRVSEHSRLWKLVEEARDPVILAALADKEASSDEISRLVNAAYDDAGMDPTQQDMESAIFSARIIELAAGARLTQVTVRDDAKAGELQELWGDKRLKNGKVLNVEETILWLAENLTGDVTDTINNWKAMEDKANALIDKGATPEEAYGFLAADFVAKRIDENGNEVKATVGQIYEGGINNFLLAMGEDVPVSPNRWAMNETVDASQRSKKKGLVLTGPSNDTGMMFSAFNAAAAGVTSRLEDSEDASPEMSGKEMWIQQLNLKRMYEGRFESGKFTHPTKKYLPNDPAVLSGKKKAGEPKEYALDVKLDTAPAAFHRVPGIHLSTPSVTVRGKRIPAFIAVMAVYMLNNYDNLHDNGFDAGFYLPKSKWPKDMLLWNKALFLLETRMGLQHGAIKAKVMHERAEFSLSQFVNMWVVQMYSLITNVGRWDQNSSFIQTFKRFDSMLFPDQRFAGMLTERMTYYTLRNAFFNILVGVTPKTAEKIDPNKPVQLVELTNALAEGGMAVQLKNNPKPEDSAEIAAEKLKLNKNATADIRTDKIRERLIGLQMFVKSNGQKILLDSTRESWVATTDSEYVKAGSEVFQVELNANGATLEDIVAPLQAYVDANVSPAMREKFIALGILGEGGKIKPIEYKKEDLTKEKIDSPENWARFMMPSKGERTLQGLAQEVFFTFDYNGQQVAGNNAAAVENPLDGNGWKGILEANYTGNRLMSDHATNEGNLNGLYVTLLHGQKFTQDGKFEDLTGTYPPIEVKKGDVITPDLVYQLWLHLKAFTEKRLDNFEAKGIPVNRAVANTVMETVKRILIKTNEKGEPVKNAAGHLELQPVNAMPYFSKILYRLNELYRMGKINDANNVLNGIFLKTREQLEAEGDQFALDTHKDVFNIDGARPLTLDEAINREWVLPTATQTLAASKSRVEAILAHPDFTDEPQAVKNNLEAIYSHGILAGTGQVVILPIDQGLEHSPIQSWSSNPVAADKWYQPMLAHTAGMSAYAAPYGTIKMIAPRWASSLPLIAKINNSVGGTGNDKKNQQSAVMGDIAELAALGVRAIGFTIYGGSLRWEAQIKELEAVTAEAKKHGLPTIVWSYPRGGDMPAEQETALDVTIAAVQLAVEAGANVVKIKPPMNVFRNPAKKAWLESQQWFKDGGYDLNKLEDRIKIVTLFANGRELIFSGGAAKAEDEVLDEIARVILGGGGGNIVGRNLFKRPFEKATPLALKIMALNQARTEKEFDRNDVAGFMKYAFEVVLPRITASQRIPSQAPSFGADIYADGISDGIVHKDDIARMLSEEFAAETPAVLAKLDKIYRNGGLANANIAKIDAVAYTGGNPADYSYPASLTKIAELASQGVDALGYTLNPDPGFAFNAQIAELAAIIKEGRKHGLPTVVWSFPTGDKSDALDITTTAAQIALEVGAHVIVVKEPSAEFKDPKKEQVELDKAKIPYATLEERKQIVRWYGAFGGRRKVVFESFPAARKDFERMLSQLRAVSGQDGTVIVRNGLNLTANPVLVNDRQQRNSVAFSIQGLNAEDKAALAGYPVNVYDGATGEKLTASPALLQAQGDRPLGIFVSELPQRESYIFVLMQQFTGPAVTKATSDGGAGARLADADGETGLPNYLHRHDGDEINGSYRNYSSTQTLTLGLLMEAIQDSVDGRGRRIAGIRVTPRNGGKSIALNLAEHSNSLIASGDLITVSFEGKGARLAVDQRLSFSGAPFVEVAVPATLAAAVQRKPYDLVPTRLQILPLTEFSATQTKAVSENPLAIFAIGSSIAQALGSILFAGKGKAVKEVADGNAVHFSQRSMEVFTKENPKVAIVVLADEGGRDDSFSLELGSVFFAGKKEVFTGVRSLQALLKELQDQNVQILYFVGDALEKTNGLIIPEAATSATDSNSLFAFYIGGENRYLINDNFRLGAFSGFVPSGIDAGVTPFDLPSTALAKIAAADKTFMADKATILTLGPRTADLEKDAIKAQTTHRHAAIMADAKLLQANNPNLRMVFPGDGDLLPRIVAELGLDLDGSNLFVFGRSGAAEATAAGIVAANTPGAQFSHTLVSEKATNGGYGESTAHQFTQDDLGRFQELGIPESFYNATRTRSDVQGSGIVAVTSVTGASEGIFGKTFSGIFRRVTFNEADNTVVTNTLLSTPQGAFIVRSTFKSADLAVTKEGLLQASHPAREYRDQQTAGDQGARLSIAPVTSTTFTGSTQSFFTNVGAFVRSGTEVRLALAEETLNVYTLRNDSGKLVVIEGERTAVLDLKSGLSKEAQAKDLEGISQSKGLTEQTSELRVLNSVRGPLTQGGEPALFLIDISSFTGLESPKAEFENLLIQQDRKLDGLSRVAFVGTEAQVKDALKLVETLSLKHKDQFSSFDAVSKDFSKSPRIALVKQGYTLPDNVGYDYKVTLQSEKNGQTGVFAFGAIQALMEYAAQDNLEEAFKLFLTLAPSYRGRITYDQFKRFLEGDEEVISEFPLPATIWASLQDAVKLYQLSRTVAYSA